MSLRLLCLLMFAITVPLMGGLEKYFKPVENKSHRNKMRGIDCIYMINLDERPEKFARSAEELAPYKIYPCRFSAVNGWKLPLETLNAVGVKYTSGMPTTLWGTAYLTEDFAPHHEIMQCEGRNYFSHCMSRGAVAICLSHLSILYDALKSGYETIWVMEDDIQVLRDPRILPLMMIKLDELVGRKNWDILFTDPDTKNAEGQYIPCTAYAKKPNFNPRNPERFAERRHISDDFTEINARYGGYSMLIKRSGMRKIMNHFKNYGIFLPYDMEYYLPDDIHLYSMRYDIVSTLPKALSDNGSPGYQKKEVISNDSF